MRGHLSQSTKRQSCVEQPLTEEQRLFDPFTFERPVMAAQKNSHHRNRVTATSLQKTIDTPFTQFSHRLHTHT
jgi:hypothetical protein